MRTLPAGIPISADVRRPVWLATLAFPSGTVRYSSRETITIQDTSVVYTAASIEISAFTQDARGQMRATLRVPSHDGALRTLVLSSGDWRGQAATLALIYGDGPWNDADIVPEFDGTMDGAPEAGLYVTLSLVSTRHATEFAPRHIAQAPFCNHIPPAGASITWGGQTTILPGTNGSGGR